VAAESRPVSRRPIAVIGRKGAKEQAHKAAPAEAAPAKAAAKHGKKHAKP
jgi:hypothetical protein